MENQIYNILNDMAEFLNVMQMKKNWILKKE